MPISSSENNLFILLGAGVVATAAYFALRPKSTQPSANELRQKENVEVLPLQISTIIPKSSAVTTSPEKQQFNSNTSSTLQSLNQNRSSAFDLNKVLALVPSAPKQEQTQAPVQQQNAAPSSNDAVDFAGHFGLTALSTISAVPKIAENVLLKQALLTGVKNVELIGLPAGIAADVIYEHKSLPVAVVANTAGDVAGAITGIAGSAVATPIGGALISAGTQIYVTDEVYKFADNFNIK